MRELMVSTSLSALIGQSTVIRHVQQLVIKVAESEAPVLVTGEPGTGKEMLARSIHDRSNRSSSPFVPVKCAAISEDLLEAELFGHAQGAFPGAHQERQGRFELANGGTLYLDEVCSLSLRMQALLLRYLSEGVIQPVGSQRMVNPSVRIVCSTSTNIDQAVRERSFREDLYYRLAQCAVYVPPLRERREDIPALVEHFIHKYNQSKGKSISGVSPDAMSALLQHLWPNNIREVENLIDRIVVLKNSGGIEICDLPPRLRNLVTDNIDTFYEKSRIVSQQPANNRGTQPSHNSSGASSMMGGNNFNKQQMAPRQSMPSNNSQPSFRTSPQSPSHQMPYNPEPKNSFASQSPYNESPSHYNNNNNHGGGFEEGSEIDQFIKKDIDLGNGIDFYRVVEEFENRLIAEALRRTNHNKNRAAQLLSMNRTTLVEKLKKRAASNPVKVENGRVKRNPAFTIFDGLGNDTPKFDMDFMTELDNDGLEHDR